MMKHGSTNTILKRSGKVHNSWILHHDNAPAHTALSAREFLATKQVTVLEHPAYSPDLARNYFFSVPEDKGNIERKAFWWHRYIRNNTTAALKAGTQNQFQNCFEGWTGLWHRCIASQGEYFEGEHVVFSNEVCTTFTGMSSRTILYDHVHRMSQK